MTDKIKDGGPAFPKAATASREGSQGMTLRDYFAAAALTGMGTWMPTHTASGNVIPGPESLCNPSMQSHRARLAYEQADRMLAAREQSS